MLSMDDVPVHLHHELNLDTTDLVYVHLNNPAKVFLMTPENYRHFLAWDPFEAFGGEYDHSPVRLQAPQAGTWHLAVQQVNEALSLTIRVELISASQEAPKAKARPKPSKAATSPVEWDLSNPNHVVLCVDKARKFLTRNEMNAFIHQIVRGKNDLARKKLTYSWLQKERNDILVEAKIDNYLSPILAEMIRIIREKLSIPGKG